MTLIGTAYRLRGNLPLGFTARLFPFAAAARFGLLARAAFPFFPLLFAIAPPPRIRGVTFHALNSSYNRSVHTTRALWCQHICVTAEALRRKRAPTIGKRFTQGEGTKRGRSRPRGHSAGGPRGSRDASGSLGV